MTGEHPEAQHKLDNNHICLRCAKVSYLGERKTIKVADVPTRNYFPQFGAQIKKKILLMLRLFVCQSAKQDGRLAQTPRGIL